MTYAALIEQSSALAAQQSENQAIAPLTKRFAPIGLKQMNDVALLDRRETKYVLPVSRLAPILAALTDSYRVLQIEGRRLNRYRTLYFDSAEFFLYHRHHAGARDRYKVRSREYLDSDRCYFEVKHKTNKKRTRKQRLETAAPVRVIGGEMWRFLRDAYPHNADALYGRLYTEYQRVTLVSTHHAERVTIDVNLRFAWNDRSVALPHIAVVELKREGRRSTSAFGDQLRRLGIRPQRFSKYCAGVSLLYPSVKHNNFKPTLRLIENLSREDQHVYSH